MNHQRRTNERSSLALLLAVEIAAVLVWPGLVVVGAESTPPPSGPAIVDATTTPLALVRPDSCWVQPGVGVACSVADASATPEVLP